MKSLANKIAVVTGASRGVGKGIALGLGEAGATVYVTGRTTQEGKNDEAKNRRQRGEAGKCFQHG